jgi:hypothetical protein
MKDTMADTIRQKPTVRFVLKLFLLGTAMAICAKVSAGVLRHWDVPYWLKIFLALMPLLPLVVGTRMSTTVVQADELAVKIHHDAVVFAFYALFAVLICVDLLSKGGVLTGFGWNTEWIVGTMLAMLAAGYGWAYRRYR